MVPAFEMDKNFSFFIINFFDVSWIPGQKVDWNISMKSKVSCLRHLTTAQNVTQIEPSSLSKAKYLFDQVWWGAQ